MGPMSVDKSPSRDKGGIYIEGMESRSVSAATEKEEEAPLVGNNVSKEETRSLRRWVPDEESDGCMVCGQRFTIRNRRHHCRLCGRLVDHRCSSNRILLATLKMDSKVRVCDPCFARHAPSWMLKRSNPDSASVDRRGSGLSSSGGENSDIEPHAKSSFFRPNYQQISSSDDVFPVEDEESCFQVRRCLCNLCCCFC